MRVLLLLLAAAMLLAGGLWWAGGSEVLGPLLAGLGVALGIVVVQHRHRGGG